MANNIQRILDYSLHHYAAALWVFFNTNTKRFQQNDSPYTVLIQMITNILHSYCIYVFLEEHILRIYVLLAWTGCAWEQPSCTSKSTSKSTSIKTAYIYHQIKIQSTFYLASNLYTLILLLSVSSSSLESIGFFEKDQLCRYLKLELFFVIKYFLMMYIPMISSSDATTAISIKQMVRHNLERKEFSNWLVNYY